MVVCRVRSRAGNAYPPISTDGFGYPWLRWFFSYAHEIKFLLNIFIILTRSPTTVGLKRQEDQKDVLSRYEMEHIRNLFTIHPTIVSKPHQHNCL